MISLVSVAQSSWVYELSPEDGDCSVSSEGTFTITFSDKDKVFPVKGGKISLNASDGTQLYPIQFLWPGAALPPEPWVFESSISDGTVTFSGNQVIIDFNAALAELKHYYITVHPQSIRDAAQTQFPGLVGDANVDESLTCDDDGDYGWDFTVEDITKPGNPTLTPAFNAVNVATNAVLKMVFNVNMDWASGQSLAGLQPGDIALYSATDDPFGQYGGDVIFTKPVNVSITNKTIEITWPDDMPSTTTVYVRIKSGIFKKFQECPSCNPEFLWNGFNNLEWKFTTKDNRAPKVTIAATSVCDDPLVAKNTNFTITLDEEVIYTNNVVPFNALKVNDNVASYVTFSGGSFTAKVTSVTPSGVVITVDPANNLTSDQDYTVGLKEGSVTGKADLWDASLNMVPVATKTFTAGDFLPPTFTTLESVSEDGTTFQILSNSPEPSTPVTVHYIVVEKDDVWEGGTYKYKPSKTQVTDLAAEWDDDGNPNLPRLDPFQDINWPLDFYISSTGSKHVNIWAAGIFNMNVADEDNLERVFDLPRTNGTEYQVIVYAEDASPCGPNWTNEIVFDAATLDALPPVPGFSAERDLSAPNCLAASGWQKPVLRDGPVYVNFNEPVVLTSGDINDGDDIAAAFHLFERPGGGDPWVEVAISNASYYDAANNRIVLIPVNSFSSGYKIQVLMPVNTVEDLAGNERNLAADHTFCVESYCEPHISWLADKVDYPNSTNILEDEDLEYCDPEVAKDATVQVVFDMPVFVPLTNGSLAQLGNNQSNAATWVGNFIKIRESATGCSEAETGSLIYEAGNLVNFDITVNAYDDEDQPYTVITIEPGEGFEYRSEYYYNIEIDARVQSYSRLTILEGLCYGESNDGPAQTNHISFQVTDHSAPSVFFYEATGAYAYVRDLNACVDCDNPTTQFGLNNVIGVYVTEWIELGFDGFRDLEPTEIIQDANALRRYFSLETCTGEAISFDVLNFQTDESGNLAVMFIDPYYPGGVESPNFKTGINYTVKFLSNKYEEDYGPGAFADGHGNLVQEAEACFTGYVTPEALSCEGEFSATPEVCEGVGCEGLQIGFNFDNPMAWSDMDGENGGGGTPGEGNCEMVWPDDYDLPEIFNPIPGVNWIEDTWVKFGSSNPPVPTPECDPGCVWIWTQFPDYTYTSTPVFFIFPTNFWYLFYGTGDPAEDAQIAANLAQEAGGYGYSLCGDGCVIDLGLPDIFSSTDDEYDVYGQPVLFAGSSESNRPVASVTGCEAGYEWFWEVEPEYAWTTTNGPDRWYLSNQPIGYKVPEGEGGNGGQNGEGEAAEVCLYIDLNGDGELDADEEEAGPACCYSLEEFSTDVSGTFWSHAVDCEECGFEQGDNVLVVLPAGAFYLPYGGVSCEFPQGEEDELVVVGEFSIGDNVAPYITTLTAPYSLDLNKDSEDIILEFSEAVVPVSGQAMEFFEVGTNKKVATVYMQDVDMSTDGLTMTIDNSLFSANLIYEMSYYVQYNPGLVVDLCDNPLEEGCLTKECFTFTVGEDPAPMFVCDEYSPMGEIIDTEPDFEISFTEPVDPVAQKIVSIFEQEEGSSECLIFGTFFVTGMTPNSSKTKYSIPYSEITKLSGNELKFGSTYFLNISEGAFIELSGGDQTTPEIVSWECASCNPVTDCPWIFNIDDTQCPQVTFWPKNGYKNVPVNAHLFVGFDEPVELSSGMALNTVTGQSYFSLTKGGNPVPFRVQQVAPDKTWVMIVPEDPDAPELQTTDNVHMEDDVEYTLSVVPSGPWGTLQDAYENAVGGCDDGPWSVKFRTEDVTCPTEENDVTMLTVSQITASGFKMTVTLPEFYGYGKVNYRVVKAGTGVNGTLVASGTVTFTSSLTTSKNITGINASTGTPASPGNGYDFDIWLEFVDDETDRFDEDSEILAEWPYNEIAGLELIRIRDLNPAPNTCGYENMGDVTLCDDDAPLVVTPLEYQPQSGGWAAAIGVNSVPVTSNLRFTLNEPVSLEGAPGFLTPEQIALRDYENNLLVPATITLGGDMKTITINPDANLMDEHRYYITWDRYAVKDTAERCNAANFLAEKIDKSWWFKTMDNTKPVVECQLSEPSGECVERTADIILTVRDGNRTVVNSSLTPAFIDIYEESDDPTIPHERIPLSRHIKEFVGMSGGDSIWTFTFQTVYEYLSGECYYAVIPANLFIDSFGNKSADVCELSWCVEDYEAPVPEWVAKIDYSYMYTAYTDDQYVATWDSGIPGEELTDVPTSSHFAVTFNEETQIWDDEDDAWRDLSYAIWDPSILDGAITITNDGEPLEYGFGGYWLQYIPGSGNTAFRIIIANDFSHLGYGSWGFPIDWNNLPYLLGSMKSNSQYQITLNGGVISDMADEQCGNGDNIIEDDVLMLTVTTRDDTPPELTIYDANGAVICDANCPKAGSFYLNGNQPTYDVDDPNWWWQWTPPMWPGQFSDGDDLNDCVNICVAESDHIRLQFNKAVVKTPSELINPPAWMQQPLWWLQPGVDWWTEANLPLKPEDLADPSTSRFIKFQKWNGEGWEDAGVNFNVTIHDWSTFDLAWEGTLESEGIYAITFAPIVVKDTTRIPDGNEFLGMTCTFKVVDHLAPEFMEPVYIADDACGQWNGESAYPMDLGTGTQLGMLFNEPVQPGPAGKKLIIRRENGQQQQIIDASDITVSSDGYTVYLHNADFEENTLYYVEIMEGFVEDTAFCGSNPYPGIDPEDSTPGWQALIPTFEWVFKTGDNTPPEPLEEDGEVVGLFPAIGATDVAKNTDLVVTFDENIFTGCAPLAAGCDPHEGEIMHDYLGQGIYIYADNGATPGVDFGNFVEFIPFMITVADGNGGTEIQNPRIEFSGSDIYNGMVSDIVTINPVTVFERNVTYYIRISGNLFCDDFGNKWAGYRDYEWYFTITNDVAPVIEWAIPALFTAEGAPETVPAQPNGYAVTDLEMYFVDEMDHLPLNVAKGTGVIRIYEYIYNPLTFSYYEKLYKTIDINDDDVEITGNIVKVHGVTLLDDINPDNECLGPRMYYVTVEPGAITNGYPGSLTFWEGFNDAFDWRFYTAADDTFMVGHNIVRPLPGEVNLSIEDASTLEITFAEDIEAWEGTEGKVKIFEVDGGALVDEITVMDDHINGNVLTVTTDALVDETGYYVTIDPTAFGDTSTCSTPFYGLLDTTEWTFATGDNTPPVPVWAADLGDCEDPCVTLTFMFNESQGVSTGTGMVNIWTADTIFASAPAVVGDDVNTITAEFCGLPDTTVFFISLDSAAVNDNGNNELPNAMIALPEWTFATGDNTAPELTAIGPAGDAEESDVTLEVKASEEVVAVAGKKVILTDGVTNWEFDATEMLSVDGMTFTLPVAGLEDVTTFTVTVEAGAFEDLSCEPNATEEATEWSFTTDDNTAPVVEETTPEAAEELDTYIGLAIDFTFNEDVVAGTGNVTVTRGTHVLDLDVTGEDVVVEGAKVTLVLDEMVYFGDVTVTVPEGAFVDLATEPNDNVAYEWTFSIVDEQFEPDCMDIIEPVDGTAGVLSQPNLIMEFCERVSACATDKYVHVYELNSTGTNVPVAHILITNDMIQQPDRLGVVIPLNETTILESYNTERPGTLKDNQDYIVMADMGAICDENSNPWEGISNPTLWNFTTGDNTPPTVYLQPSGSENDKNDIVVDAIFSEKVVDAAGLIDVDNALDYTIETDNDSLVYTISIKADDMDTVTITVPTTITDIVDAKGYGNPLVEEVVGHYVVGDNTAPEVTVTSAPAEPNNTLNTFTVELTFSEQVTGVEAALAESVGLVDWSANADSTVYLLTFEGEDETSGKLLLDADKVTDVSVNANKLDNGIDWPFTVGDHVAPTAVVDPLEGDDLRVDTLKVTITFSEEVVGAELGSGILVSGGNAVVSNDGLVYTVAITAADLAEVTLSLTSEITDDSYNENELAPASYTYQFGDRTAPTVSVDPAQGVGKPTSFEVLIVFNEDVTGVGTGSIKLTGDGAAIQLSTIVAGRAYKAVLKGNEKADIVLSFTDAIKDLAGNAIVPVQFNYTIGDFTAPTMVADPASGTFINNEFEVTLTFDEEVTHVAEAVSVSTGSVVVTGSGMVYKAVVTSPSLSSVVLTVSNKVKDLAGNAFAGASFTYNVTGLVKIATIQGKVNSSPVAGKVLQTKGTITGVSPFEGFFMQDENAAWGGIWVAYGNTQNLKIGDGVHVVGTVAEVSSVTTINATSVTEIVAPLTVVPLVVASPAAAKNEMYESVLVKVNDATATAANDIGNWTIYYQTINNIVVANWLYSYTPLEGGEYNVTGIVNARLEAFKLEPRMLSDIEAASILTVQGKANETGWAGRTVQLTGTVTGISPSEGFFMQDANAAWSGIWVSFGNTQNLAIGDGVQVTGVVAEIATVTTINATQVTEVGVPLTVEAVVVDSPAGAKNEMYESVLVKVEGARANAANDIKLWTIYYQPVNNIVVSNWMYTYTPEAGHFYDVTGILNTRLEAFKLEPRIEADIVDLTATTVDPVASVEFKVYPNPFNERIYIDNFDKLTRVVINNIAGQRVMDIEYPEREIRTANLVSGVYLISLMTEEGIVKTERIVKR